MRCLRLAHECEARESSWVHVGDVSCLRSRADASAWNETIYVDLPFLL